MLNFAVLLIALCVSKVESFSPLTPAFTRSSSTSLEALARRDLLEKGLSAGLSAAISAGIVCVPAAPAFAAATDGGVIVEKIKNGIGANPDVSRSFLSRFLP